MYDANTNTELAVFGYVSTFTTTVHIDVGPNHFFSPGVRVPQLPKSVGGRGCPWEWRRTGSAPAGRFALSSRSAYRS